MNWHTIYIKPKCEDLTLFYLNRAGIETLNPKRKIKKYVRKKYTDVIEQLFPCYIFAFFDKEKDSHMIKYTRGVRYIVGKENPIIVNHEIIDAIMERMEGNIVNPAPGKLKKGDRILIKDGPFKDFYGIFERDISGKERAVIFLETLYCKLHIESRSIKRI